MGEYCISQIDTDIFALNANVFHHWNNTWLYSNHISMFIQRHGSRLIQCWILFQFCNNDLATLFQHLTDLAKISMLNSNVLSYYITPIHGSWINISYQGWISVQFRKCNQCWYCNVVSMPYFLVNISLLISKYFTKLRIINWHYFNIYTQGNQCHASRLNCLIRFISMLIWFNHLTRIFIF